MDKEKQTVELTGTTQKCTEVVSTDGAIHVLPIIGQIEGHYVLPENQKATKYEQIIPRLVDLEQDESVGGVLLILHTLGGDVEAGLAMAEMIASMKTPTVSLVLGGGHSIGVPLAVAARKSLIVPSATMTIHPVRVSGTVLGAPQTYRYLSEMQSRIVDFVVRHSHMDEKRFLELMMCPDELATDVGSVVEGAEAVREGLIDRIGGLSEALQELRGMAGVER
ncbi:MAG: ATP-dependent Clp protease proteolytic subunit [Clostridia bacterium]|nr:ATP-dependent Clp protease proteolytic subunit [Clostridia bacterium]